jgi:hypothetical protein
MTPNAKAARDGCELTGLMEDYPSGPPPCVRDAIR